MVFKEVLMVGDGYIGSGKRGFAREDARVYGWRQLKWHSTEKRTLNTRFFTVASGAHNDAQRIFSLQ